MEDEAKSNITFNIYGGSNQILPTATQAVQNFYGDEFAKEKLVKEGLADAPLTDDERGLSLYINNGSALRGYVTLLRTCHTARELAEVVATICQQEPAVTEQLIVKAEFIQLLLPFVPEWSKGQTISNIRTAINNAWAARRKALRSTPRR